MMSEDNHLMIVDREELNLFKDKINNYLYEISYSFASLIYIQFMKVWLKVVGMMIIKSNLNMI